MAAEFGCRRRNWSSCSAMIGSRAGVVVLIVVVPGTPATPMAYLTVGAVGLTVRMLTERSVYASVLPPSQGRREGGGPVARGAGPTPSQADRPTRVPRPDEPRRPRRPRPAGGARRLLVRHPWRHEARRVLGLAGLQDRLACDAGDVAGRRGRPDRRRPRAGDGRHPQAVQLRR